MITNILVLCLFLPVTGLVKKEDAEALNREFPDDVPTEKSLKDFSGDWLFHVRTTSCDLT